MNLADVSKFHRSRSPVMFVLLALAAVCALGLCLLPGSPDVAGRDSGDREPMLPLTVAWVASDSDPALPDSAFSLVMTAQTDLPSVRLEVLLPQNVSLLSGPASFQGKLGRGEEKRFVLRISRRGAAKLQARATAVTPGGLVFQRGASIDLGAEGEVPNRLNPARLVCSPDGRLVREFAAASAGEGRR